MGRVLAWFHGRRVSQKLALISVFFLVPDSVLLCLFLFTLNGHIRFAELERAGNEYQRPLEELLEHLPEHQTLVRGAEGGRVGAEDPRVTEVAGEIDAAMERLEEVQGRLGERLQFTDEGLAKRRRERCMPLRLREEWRALRDGWRGWPALERTERHQRLLADVRATITHAGDNSNLILDPDLDSYYLMDATLLALPQLQERLALVLAYADDVLGGRPLTAAQRTQLAVYAALLREADVDRVLASVETALNEDANFYGVSPELHRNLPPALAEFRMAGGGLLTLLDGLGKGPGGEAGVSRAEFAAAGRRARAASFALWHAAHAELDRLLERRIRHFQARRARSLLLTGLALAAAVGFVGFITHSISGPLQRQAAELRVSNEALQSEIRDRERVEDALRTAEAKYRSIFENAVEGIFQSSPEGRYLTVNPTLARMYGYDSPAALQAALTDIGSGLYVDPGRRAEFQSQMDRDGEVRGFESEVRRRDGSRLWISEHARLVRSADGRPLYYEGTVEDITARKRHEETLERMHRELRDAHRVQNEFLANASHELLTPMNGICGFLELLAETSLSGEQREYVGESRACSRSLLRLIQGILDYNRAEAGSLSVERREFIPAELLRQGTREAAVAAEARGLFLRVDAEPEAWQPWLGPAEVIGKVLTLLLDNALKFTARGGITVMVGVGSSGGSGAERALQFTVIDTGVGLTRKQAEWIRIPFAQADGGMTRRSSGIGLGLPLATRLVRAAGGELALTGEQGRGAVARFTVRAEPVVGRSAQSAA